MRIRKAKKDDLPQIIDLWWEMHISHYKYDRPYYKLRTKTVARKNIEKHYSELIDSAESIFVVADDRGIIVGYLCALVQNRPPVFLPSKRLLIDTTAVREAYRGKGIFHKLYLGMKRSAVQHQPYHIELFVDMDNPAVELYKHLGFKGRQLKMYRDFQP